MRKMDGVWFGLTVCAMLWWWPTTDALDVPVVQPFLVPPNLQLGDRLQLFCNIVKGSFPVEFKWHHNGRQVTTKTDIPQGDPGKQYTSHLVIESLSATNIGNYTCTASNAVGTDSYSAVLEIEAPPEWIREPQDVNVVLGSPVLFPCKAAGHPKPKISWQREQEDKQGDGFVPIASDQRHRIFGNGSLFIKKTVEEDSGYFRCDVSNGIGPALSRTVKLSVKVPPRVAETFKTANVRRGETASLRCTVSGDQPVHVQWIRKGVPVEATEMTGRLDTQVQEGPEGVTSELIIRQSEREDAGLYKCLASNEAGSTEAQFKLAVVQPPSSPQSISVPQTTSRSARIAWKPPHNSDEPVTAYIVRFWKNAGSRKLMEVNVLPTESSLLLEELSPGSSYTFQLLAENAVGVSKPTKPSGFKTQEEAPASPPSDVAAVSIGANEVKVSWKAPPPEQWHGVLKGYYVGHRVTGSSSPYSYRLASASSKSEDVLFVIADLDKSTEYSIVVKAFNDAGSGPASSEVLVRTHDGDPPPPPQLHVPELTPSSVRVSWTFQKYPSPIRQCLLQFRRESDPWQDLHLSGEKTSVVLTELDGHRQYDFRMALYSRYGRGNFSSVVTITTESAPLLGLGLGPDDFVPIYFQPQMVIPLAASTVVIFTAIVMSWVCYKKHAIQQEQASSSSQIQPDQVYPYNRNRLSQGDGYCDISRIPLYLHQNGHTRSSSLGRRIHQSRDDTYDVPWDATQNTTTANHEPRAPGSYTRLKNGIINHHPKPSSSAAAHRK